MPRSDPTRTWRFRGRIAGWGTASGTRFVLGNWHTTPLGRFAGVMVQRPSGERLLLAPSMEVAEFVSATYQFDAVEPVAVSVRRYAPDAAPAGGAARRSTGNSDSLSPADPVEPLPPTDAAAPLPSAAPLPVAAPTTAGERWQVEAGPLSAHLRIGKRTPLGWLLRALPPALAGAPWFSYVTDPIARVVLPGVRTRGSAGGGRREYYGANDLHRLEDAATTWDGEDLGAMVPIDPPVEFGFASTPARPSVTDLLTTVRDRRAGPDELPGRSSRAG